MIKYFKVLLFLCIAVGQSNGFIINDIEVVGNEIISDDNIKFISGLEQGMYVNSFNIQNSIKRLWDTKRYLDIDIKVEEKYLSNKLIIYVKEAPFLGSIILF